MAYTLDKRYPHKTLVDIDLIADEMKHNKDMPIELCAAVVKYSMDNKIGRT